MVRYAVANTPYFCTLFNSHSLEQQIDNMVYKLYELTYEKVKIIDPENTLTEKEYADIKI